MNHLEDEMQMTICETLCNELQWGDSAESRTELNDMQENNLQPMFRTQELLGLVLVAVKAARLQQLYQLLNNIKNQKFLSWLQSSPMLDFLQ